MKSLFLGLLVFVGFHFAPVSAVYAESSADIIAHIQAQAMAEHLPQLPNADMKKLAEAIEREKQKLAQQILIQQNLNRGLEARPAAAAQRDQEFQLNEEIITPQEYAAARKRELELRKALLKELLKRYALYMGLTMSLR